MDAPLNADLDRSDRLAKWKLAAVLASLALVVVTIWLSITMMSASQDRAVSAASQRFTLGQQVAAACAIKTQADDLGGLCQSATQIVKEGPAGSPGLAGPPGNTGPQGPLGPKGEQGVQGFQGVTGTSGAQGLLGAPGAAGVQGIAGSAGVDGTAGASGPAGANGLPGAIGATGPAGPAGQTPTAMTCVKAVDPNTVDGWDCTVTAWRP